MFDFGYIDAGSGSLFIQTIFGVVLAAVVVLRGFIFKTYSKLKLIFSRQKTTDEEA